MASCSCMGYGEPKYEGHWLGCASWGAPSFNARLPADARAQRERLMDDLRQQHITELRTEADRLEAQDQQPRS